MKATILLAALVANFATANIIDKAKEAPMKLLEFVEDHTFTKEEAEEISRKHHFRKATPSQERSAKDSHMRIRATREKLGLPMLGDPRVSSDYTGSGFISAMLGAAKGLMYQPSDGHNHCYSSIEGSLLSWGSFSTVFKNVYMPWYWADVQIVM